MNPATKTDLLPSITADVLSDPLILADNMVARLWKSMTIPTLLCRAGINKRSGLPAPDVVYLLLLWVWLKTTSVRMFSRSSLQSFTDARKDVMYDFLKREDTNWRTLQIQAARKVYMDHRLKECRIKAFVVDDSVKIRRGKKMGGVSCHFDHLTGRSVMGQQVLTLGMATESTFLPLDQDIFISATKVQPQSFKDNRSVAARRYKQSRDMTKPELLVLSVQRALRNGFEADYFLADAWFGNKSTIRLTEECSLTAILRMKKDKTKYRWSQFENGVMQQEMLNAVELFQKVVRKQWDKISGMPYQAKTIEVDLNLAQKKSAPDQWITVRLQFVRGICDDDKPQPGKHHWALFLSTDPKLTAQSMLEIYALRWGIEVYFKEGKQNLGLLKEQTINFASHIASISLTAIRYLMLLHESLSQGRKLSEVRSDMSDGLVALSFGSRLWGLFRSLINNSVEQFRSEIGAVADEIMVAIEQSVNRFFVQALQLDAFTMELEALPDAA
jgi:hypothetical protein